MKDVVGCCVNARRVRSSGGTSSQKHFHMISTRRPNNEIRKAVSVDIACYNGHTKTICQLVTRQRGNVFEVVLTKGGERCKKQKSNPSA